MKKLLDNKLKACDDNIYEVIIKHFDIDVLKKYSKGYANSLKQQIKLFKEMWITNPLPEDFPLLDFIKDFWKFIEEKAIDGDEDRFIFIISSTGIEIAWNMTKIIFTIKDNIAIMKEYEEILNKQYRKSVLDKYNELADINNFFYNHKKQFKKYFNERKEKLNTGFGLSITDLEKYSKRKESKF